MSRVRRGKLSFSNLSLHEWKRDALNYTSWTTRKWRIIFREILYVVNWWKIRIIYKGKEIVSFCNPKMNGTSLCTMSIERNQHLLKYYIFMDKSGTNKRSNACYTKTHKPYSFLSQVFMNLNIIFSQ